MVNLVRGRECFVGLSIVLVYGLTKGHVLRRGGVLCLAWLGHGGGRTEAVRLVQRSLGAAVRGAVGLTVAEVGLVDEMTRVTAFSVGTLTQENIIR